MTVGGGGPSNPRYNLYELGTATAGTAGNSYRLCWAHEASGNTDWSFDIGTFTMSGPLTLDTSCTIQVACTLQLTGTNLATTNVLPIFDDSVACGADVATEANTGLTTEKQSDSTNEDEYAVGTATGGTPGANYRACWSHDPVVGAGLRPSLSTFWKRKCR